METTITGKVIAGEQVGRRLGYPTANLHMDPALDIRDGVYAARAEVDGEAYDAMVNVGRKPTLPTTGERILEAHLFGFSGDLYGKTVRVTLVQFVREERRFDSAEALRRQIEEDKQTILNILKSCG